MMSAGKHTNSPNTGRIRWSFHHLCNKQMLLLYGSLGQVCILARTFCIFPGIDYSDTKTFRPVSRLLRGPGSLSGSVGYLQLHPPQFFAKNP